MDNQNSSFKKTLSLGPRKAHSKTQVLKRFCHQAQNDEVAADQFKSYAKAKNQDRLHKNRHAYTSPVVYDLAKSAYVPKDRPKKKSINKDHEVINLKQQALNSGNLCAGLSYHLPIVSLSEKGALLDGKEHGELFIPRSQLKADVQIGDKVKVFLYIDNKICATARIPKLQLGMVGRLKVSSIVGKSAFMDMGIPKELIVPISEQKERFIENQEYTVLIAQDEQGRLFGTQRFARYIRNHCYQNEFTKGQEVKVVAIERTPLGYRVIVNDTVFGLIFLSEQKGEIIKGKRYDGYITLVRSNGKLDVSLQAQGRSGIDLATYDILKALYYSNGHLDFNDKSDPKDIEAYLHMSKSRFKKAIGALYKERYIVITDHGLELTTTGKSKFEQGLNRS